VTTGIWEQPTPSIQNIYSIGSEQPKHVLILSGDHIYKMDYGLMQKQHYDSGADVTVATILMDPTEFGILEWLTSIGDSRINRLSGETPADRSAITLRLIQDFGRPWASTFQYRRAHSCALEKTRKIRSRATISARISAQDA